MERIYVAFPGVGKSTYVKQQKLQPRVGTVGCVDLDVKGPNCWKGIKCPTDIREMTSDYVEAILRNHGDVCTHIWSFNPDRLYKAKIVVVIPPIICKDAWLARIVMRGDVDFAKQMGDNWKDWIRGWYDFYKELKKSGNDVRLLTLNPNYYLSDLAVALDNEPSSGEWHPTAKKSPDRFSALEGRKDKDYNA